MFRSPVVCILAHVDHGKTSILDYIRGTAVVSKEAGGITQMIGAYYLPKHAIINACGPLAQTADKSLKVPGLLFIDTPGHAAFTSMRERGGSIADIAILVIDIMQGIQPQTVESIKILQANKTPFIIALNKVDLLHGWKKQPTTSIAKSLASQSIQVQELIEEKLYEIVGKLAEFGFESERYDRIEDFTKQITIVPVSAKTGEGIAELLLYLGGLCQKFLTTGLESHVQGPAKGSILEVKEEKGLGKTLDVIIYDGTISKNDLIVFATSEGAKVTKVRGLLRPPITGEYLQPGSKYIYVPQVHAAAGIKIYAPGLDDALAGSPLMVVPSKRLEQKIEIEITTQVRKILVNKDQLAGIVLKADTLGSAEAFLRLLAAENIPVKEIGLGPVSKKDIISAHTSSIQNKYVGVILGFNVPVSADALEEAKRLQVPLFTSRIIYEVLQNYQKWVIAETDRDTSAIMDDAPFPAKIKVLPHCFFRLCKPAIFGVEILVGKLRAKAPIMNSNGEIIGTVKTIQHDKDSVKEALAGQQVAISIEGPYCGKTFKTDDELFVFINREQGKLLQSTGSTIFTDEEREILEQIIKMTTDNPFL